jgi:PAS domain S-box-containing protein
MSKDDLKHRLEELFSPGSHDRPAETPPEPVAAAPVEAAPVEAAPVDTPPPPKPRVKYADWYQAAFERTVIGMALVATDGQFLRVNRAWCGLLGYTEAEMLKMAFRDITHPDDVESSVGNMRKMLAGELDDLHADKRYMHKSGREVWVRLSSRLVRDHQGRPEYFISQIEDVSEARSAADSIMQRNRQLTQLNTVGQALTRLAESSEILELVFTSIGEVLDNRNLYIALYDEAAQSIAFPVYTVDGVRRDVAGRPLKNGLTEYVIRTRAPLWLPRDVEAQLKQRGIDAIGRLAHSLVAVPMLSGQKVIGVITIQDYERENVFGSDHVEMLGTLASQAAIALENARLYAQTQAALAETRRLAERERKAAVITSRLYEAADVKSLMQITAEELRKVTGSTRAVVRLQRAPDGQGRAGGR